MDGMSEPWVDDYLKRIGADAPERPDLAALRRLQRAHLLAVPFENLSIHLGEPIVLTGEALVDKLVRRGRGGFCYELNGAFGVLLAALGYEVTLLQARVFNGDVPGPPFDHLALRITLEGRPWLVDVGFGRFTHHPLRLDVADDQRDPGGVFRVTPAGLGDLDVTRDGGPEYRVDAARPYALADFVPTAWWQQTSPDSHFTRALTCSILTETGRTTLSGDRLIRTAGDRREERTLHGDAEILEAYRTHFGIVLDRVPTVRPPLAPVREG